ncbi:MAG: hypothetical protein GX090_07110, partial [Firmicutes bacterium]|nr:hypothetical protein [Bacillota bacterium]
MKRLMKGLLVVLVFSILLYPASMVFAGEEDIPRTFSILPTPDGEEDIPRTFSILPTPDGEEDIPRTFSIL